MAYKTPRKYKVFQMGNEASPAFKMKYTKSGFPFKEEKGDLSAAEIEKLRLEVDANMEESPVKQSDSGYSYTYSNPAGDEFYATREEYLEARSKREAEAKSKQKKSYTKKAGTPPTGKYTG